MFSKIRSSSKTSTGIIVVVLCASLGFCLTFWRINANIKQYHDLPGRFNVKTENRSFSLPVKLILPIDTVKNANYIDNAAKPCEEIIFHQNPSFLLWVILICSTMAIAAGSVPFFISQANNLAKEFELSAFEVWVKGILFAALIVCFVGFVQWQTKGYYEPPQIINYFKILLKDGNIFIWITAIIILLIFPGLMVMFLTGASSDKIYRRAQDGIIEVATDSIKAVEIAARRIKLLNQFLHSALQILATVIVFSALSANMLGKSIKSMVFVHGFDLYPDIAAFVYGMFFSVFLCIVYIPNYYYLKRNYNKLKELAAQLDEPKATEEWYNSLFGEIKFEGNALDNFKLALTIAAPLLTSFLPGLEMFKG